MQGLGLGLARGLQLLQMEPWLDASNPEQMDLSARQAQIWAGSGLDLFTLDSCKVWVWVWLEASFSSALAGCSNGPV